MKSIAKPPTDRDAREFLTQYYLENVRKLSASLNRQLPWRNF